MSDPRAVMLDLLFARWRAQTLYAGVKLGVFEAVDEQPADADAIARARGLDPALTYRLLRALASIGVLVEHDGRRFSVNEQGRLLRADHPESFADMVLLREGPEHTAVWKHLPDIVRDGRQDGFVREFGQSAFEYAERQPPYARAFDAGMSSQSRLQTTWVLEALRDRDFSDCGSICDVGGGQGHLLAHLLARHTHLMGTVFDRPSVIADRARLWAERLGVGDRCRYVAGDMFVEVPEADAYVLKMILHDWDDPECVTILKNLARRVSPRGRLFIAEHVIPGPDTPHYAKLFDIHMMCWGTGRERTVEEFGRLLGDAGWSLVAGLVPSSGVLGVIEGVRA